MPESEPEPDRDPVLLVSGIGGSIIHAKNKKFFGLQTRVWVRIFLSDLVFRENLISIYNPDTGPYSFFPIVSLCLFVTFYISAFLVDSAVMELLRWVYFIPSARVLRFLLGWGRFQTTFSSSFYIMFPTPFLKAAFNQILCFLLLSESYLECFLDHYDIFCA